MLFTPDAISPPGFFMRIQLNHLNISKVYGTPPGPLVGQRPQSSVQSFPVYRPPETPEALQQRWSLPPARVDVRFLDSPQIDTDDSPSSRFILPPASVHAGHVHGRG